MKCLRVVPAMAVLLAGVLITPADAARGGGDRGGGRGASFSGTHISGSRGGTWGAGGVSRARTVRVGGSRYQAPRVSRTWSTRRATVVRRPAHRVRVWPQPVAERRVRSVRTHLPRRTFSGRRVVDNRWGHSRRVRVGPRLAYYGGGYVGHPYAFRDVGVPVTAGSDFSGFGYAGYGDAYSYVYSGLPVVGESTICAAPEVVAGSSIIVALQIALRDRGFYDGEIDGIVGPQTRSAIRAFKQCAGLPVDSRLNTGFLNTLNLQ